jgi:putative two-component system response regulator
MPILRMARDIALYHHECWDGSGYPHGLAGAAIPESARIVALTDVFDALIHDRVYRPAFPEDTALAMMREGRGSQFDPTIFDCFVDVLPRLRAVREQVLAGSEPVSLPLQAAG